MKRLSLLFISMLYFFIGCSKNNTTEPSLKSDSELKSEIIGTWASPYITVSYNENGSFIETVNYIVYSDSSTTPPEAIQGSYEIKDGILMYKISDWKRFSNLSKKLLKSDLINNGLIPNKIDGKSKMQDSGNEINPIASFPDYKIQLQGDLLYYNPLSILTSTGANADEIWGDWSTVHWAIGRDNQGSLVVGKLELIYKFDKSSMTVTYGSKFLLDSLGTFNFQTDTVEYNPPDLAWGNKNYNKTIEFHNGEMYMFEKLISQIPLKKIK
jgi:hypothetical protein